VKSKTGEPIMKDLIPAIVPIALMISVFLYGYLANPFGSDFTNPTHSLAKTPKTNR